MTTITLDGYTFPEGELPWRGPLIELSEQVWSEQPTLGLTSPGTILTFMGTKSQPIPFEFRASSATANKLLAIYDARKEVTLITPQNTDGFKVLLRKLKIKHETPEAGSMYLCTGVLVSREAASGATDPGAGGPPSEGEDDVPTIVVKTVDQTKSSDTVPAADDELFFAVGMGEIWVGWIFLQVGIKAASDLKVAMDQPSGAAVNATLTGPPNHDVGDIGWNDRGGGAITVQSDSDRIVGVNLFFRASMVATAGNVALEWSQKVSVAEDTIVYAGSYLIAWKQ